MSRQYFDRYQFFVEDGKFRIVPGIEIPIKPSDRLLNMISTTNAITNPR